MGRIRNVKKNMEPVERIEWKGPESVELFLAAHEVAAAPACGD